MLFKFFAILVFAKKIFHHVFSFFIVVIIDLYFLIPIVIAHMYNPDLELAITK